MPSEKPLDTESKLRNNVPKGPYMAPVDAEGISDAFGLV